MRVRKYRCVNDHISIFWCEHSPPSVILGGCAIQGCTAELLGLVPEALAISENKNAKYYY